MLFSSITFLYYFLPVVLLLYYAAPRAFKNPVLLASSLFFYGWGEPRCLILMLITLAGGYLFGLLIAYCRKRIYLVLAILFCLSMLIYYKYVDFFIANFNLVTGLSVPLLNVALPIGISFYTFQILSYTIDVYRDPTVVQKNPLNLATYIAMFPQLIAGPIVRYDQVAARLSCRKHPLENTAYGIRRFILGLAKKIFIANTLGELVAAYTAASQPSLAFLLLYVIAFSLQIYFDFSGYSDMAIGLGKMFGFDYMENFNYPFISRSITEFWRRWHISLGSWFRDYVYIPLGGNRRHQIFNIFVVWMLTGFWHGAAWNFILWGLYFAIWLVLEKRYLLDFLKKHSILSHIYVLILVLISFMIFAGGTHDLSVPLFSAETGYYFRSYLLVLLVACIGATPLPTRIARRFSSRKIVAILEPLLYAVLLIVMTAYLVDGSFNPFLYFRF